MHIALVGTGGTIASTHTDGGVVARIPAAELLAATSQAHGLDERLSVTTLDLTTRPSFAAPLVEMGQVCLSALATLDTADAVVMTHGTDSMEETAFLLDLLHEGDQPVVVTGAQRAHDDPERDGPANIAAALAVCASDLTAGAGALLVFAGSAWPARGVHKRHTEDLDAFAAPGGPTLRVSGDHRVTRAAPRAPRSTLPGAADAVAQRGLPAVEVVAGLPGADGATVGAAVQRRPAGIVFQALGLGNASPGDLEQIECARDQGIPVLVTTRVPEGPVRPVYGGGGGFDLQRAGALMAGRTSTWQARVLLAVAVACAPERPLDLVAAWLERTERGARSAPAPAWLRPD